MPPSEARRIAGFTPFGLGLVVAASVFALDRIHKWAMLDLFRIEVRAPVRVTPFFDLLLVWNRGVSYGLFQQDGMLGQYVLVGVAVVAAILLIVWMRRIGTRLGAVALGLVVGGALGNAVDRLLWGAVADFFHLHAFGYSWYVFNVADIAIVAGVGALLYESLRPGHNDARKDL